MSQFVHAYRSQYSRCSEAQALPAGGHSSGEGQVVDAADYKKLRRKQRIDAINQKFTAAKDQMKDVASQTKRGLQDARKTSKIAHETNQVASGKRKLYTMKARPDIIPGMPHPLGPEQVEVPAGEGAKTWHQKNYGAAAEHIPVGGNPFTAARGGNASSNVYRGVAGAAHNVGTFARNHSGKLALGAGIAGVAGAAIAGKSLEKNHPRLANILKHGAAGAASGVGYGAIDGHKSSMVIGGVLGGALGAVEGALGHTKGQKVPAGYKMVFGKMVKVKK